MKFSIILCHYKTGMMTAYTVAQILNTKGSHEVEILICDNNCDDGSIKYLEPFKDQVTIVPYPKDKLQSHGIGYDVLFEMASKEFILALESDSFPTKEGWLDYYEKLVHDGCDAAGSFLSLSGGHYMHPAGALYKRSVWLEAYRYSQTLQYAYFPNMAVKESFSCHLMVHNDVLHEFLKCPEDYIVLSDSYKPYTEPMAIKKAEHYRPVVGPMHNGMGRVQESVRTYGQRNPETEVHNVMLDNKAKLIYRVGYEPGQWFCYWMLANHKLTYSIPTETKWLPGKECQQQEYTINEAGIKHLWAISAYHDYTPENEKETALYKQSVPEQLYNTLPEHQKIEL